MKEPRCGAPRLIEQPVHQAAHICELRGRPAAGQVHLSAGVYALEGLFEQWHVFEFNISASEERAANNP